MGIFRNIKATGELAQLQDEFGKLRRDFQALELEWSNMYDKLRRMMQRVVKRAEVAEKLAEADEPETPPPEPVAEGPTGRLTPAQVRMQQHILRQRAGLP